MKRSTADDALSPDVVGQSGQTRDVFKQARLRQAREKAMPNAV